MQCWWLAGLTGLDSQLGTPLWRQRLWEASGLQLLPYPSEQPLRGTPHRWPEKRRAESRAGLPLRASHPRAWPGLSWAMSMRCLSSRFSEVPVVPAHLWRAWGVSRLLPGDPGLIGALVQNVGQCLAMWWGRGHMDETLRRPRPTAGPWWTVFRFRVGGLPVGAGV